MPKSAYPTGDDAVNFWAGAGVTFTPAVVEGLDFDTKTEAEAEEWEARVGWFPFLNTVGDEKIILDTSSQGWGWSLGFGSFGGFGSWRSDPLIMDFECGILSLETIQIGETILTEGRDYQLLPLNAQRNKWPFTSLRMTTSWAMWGFTGKDIILTAKCGFCKQLPTSVWQAILMKVISESAPQVMQSSTGGTSSWKVGPAEELFITGPGSIISFAGDWACKYSEQLEFYKRRTI